MRSRARMSSAAMPAILPDKMVRTPFGPEVGAGYLGAKEAEFTAVRTILSGKLAGIAAEDIRARLRMRYL